jgi:hypothetical protein
MTHHTLLIQSHRQPLPFAWLQRCLDSARAWARRNNFEYRFIDDELFTLIPSGLREKLQQRKIIATDLARLIAIRQALQEGFETVVWLDADFYIFNAQNFILPDTNYALGREVWVQQSHNGRLKTYTKLHNAFLMFRQHNPFLEFYLQTAHKLLQQNTGPMPDQFIGPKLLSALHNICQLPVMESAGMLSPLVMQDIYHGGGAALELFIQQSPQPVYAANLCSSLTTDSALDDDSMLCIMDRLDQQVIATAGAKQKQDSPQSQTLK